MNLVETMKVLVQMNGLENCERALAEAWFAKCTSAQRWDRSPASVKLDAQSSASGILNLLECSVGVDIFLEIKGIADEGDAIHLREILNTFNNRRVIWGRKYATRLRTQEESLRWSVLTLSGYNEHMKHVLEDGSMGLFREVRVTRSDEREASDITARLIPDPLINQVAALAARGNIELLGLTSCWMSVYQTEVLQQILSMVALRSLAVWEVQFTDPIRCLTRLAEGFEKCKGIRSLEWLEINHGVVHDPLTLEPRCRLVRSLGRAPNLRNVRTRLSLGSEEMVFAVSDLIRSNSEIESLDVAFEADDSIVEGETEDELDDHVLAVGNRLHLLWPALRINTKLRKLRIEVDGSLFRYPGPPAPVVRCALGLACSPENTLSEIHIADTYHQCSFPFTSFLQQTPILPPNEVVQCKVRVFKECLCNADMPTLLHLVRDRLPYLYDIGIFPGDMRDRRKSLVARWGERSRRISEWDDLHLQLEKNQVGMTLFHDLVLPSVPIGLWPVLLAKSTIPPVPWSGVYCMLQKLVQSGIVRSLA
jgi:hypothetical protein